MVIRISGPELMDYLNGFVTFDLEKVGSQTQRCAFLTRHAKIRSLFWIKKIDQGLLFYCPEEMKQNLVEDLLKYKLSLDVKLEDITPISP